MCVCVCVCVCEREREREVMRVEREGVQMLEFDGQNSCHHFEPLLHPATKPSPSPPRRAVRHHECRVEIRHFRTLTGNGRSSYRQTKMSPTVYRTVCSGGIGKRNKKKIFLIFQKKRKIIFKKAESKKKKRNSAEKRKIDIPALSISITICDLHNKSQNTYN